MHRARELRVHLRIDQLAHLLRRLLVDDRVPDRAAVLQPVQVHLTMRGQGFEMAGTTVVLVHQPGRAVADDQRAVATRAVGDADLAVDRDTQVRAERHLLTVDRAEDVVEPETAQDALEFSGGVARDEHLGVLVHVRDQPLGIEMIRVNVRDVQVVRVADPVHQFGGELIVPGEDEPATEELRKEPRVAADRPIDGVDEDPCVADRGGTHRARLVTCPRAIPGAPRVVTKVLAGAGAGLRPQATGGSVNCWPARDTCSVQVPPSQ
ncbi:unannotated protein [freshwater metagenome]|uniref:Unannotated protein n=1 Tax=freshwater metagenome TaxID=449393 RepID=A0A6J7CA19_9ZZZZ